MHRDLSHSFCLVCAEGRSLPVRLRVLQKQGIGRDKVNAATLDQGKRKETIKQGDGIGWIRTLSTSRRQLFHTEPCTYCKNCIVTCCVEGQKELYLPRYLPTYLPTLPYLTYLCNLSICQNKPAGQSEPREPLTGNEFRPKRLGISPIRVRPVTRWHQGTRSSVFFLGPTVVVQRLVHSVSPVEYFCIHLCGYRRSATVVLSISDIWTGRL